MELTAQSLPRLGDPRRSDPHGLVAVTRSLSPLLLLAGYTQGLFPWSAGPVRWYSPDPRAIFEAHSVHLPRNLAKCARKAAFSVTFDTEFAAVMRACAQAHQAEGVWISEAFVAAYTQLQRLGFAHSVEVWSNDALVGGLYGVQVGGLFAGESMFHLQPNASKVAFAATLEQLQRQPVELFDAQVRNAHTERLGAQEVSREAYLQRLRQAVPPAAHLMPSCWS
jgi:leucyl/phenylalanyl-tRNA--protein transferase